MAEQAIHSRLNSQVSALDGRIYPLKLPENASYPAVRYQRIDAERYPVFGSYADAIDALIQVDVFGHLTAGYAAFSAVTDAVIAALSRHEDASAPKPLIDVLIESERDDFEEDTETFRKSIDIRAWYRNN